MHLMMADVANAFMMVGVVNAFMFMMADVVNAFMMVGVVNAFTFNDGRSG